MFLFDIHQVGISPIGTRFFDVKKKYQVAVDKDGFTCCTCQGATFDIGRNETAKCKHAIAVRNLLKVLKNEKNIC